MIVAIIVTFNPDQSHFKRLLDRILPQVGQVIVVDNGSSVPVADWIRPYNDAKIVWVPLHENQGIAKAHNVGIERARQSQADGVLILDHDSAPAADMVRHLQDALESKQKDGMHVAAVGAFYCDKRRAMPPPFVRIEGLSYRRIMPQNPNDIILVDHLISSGCLIPMSSLEAIGEMKEDLFIDYVDIEWGMRAKAMGYSSYGVANAEMEHDLGDRTISVLGREMALHSPLRHYYMFRNALWLYQQSYIPANFVVVDAYRFLVRFVCYILFAPQRLKNAKYILRGIYDGLRGKLGKAPF